MNKICTSLEQSQKLVELGIDVNTADMYHAPDANIVVAEPYITKTEDETLIPSYKGAIPAWSLSALLDILPLEIELHKQSDGNIKYYYMEYTTKKTYFASKRYTSPLDAAFEMICWLKENKKL